MTKRNLVGHCYRPANNNDKIYMVCVRNQGNSKWQVIVKWGRRGRSLSSQVKATFPTEAQAICLQQSIWEGQLREGYMDIESSEYRNYIGPMQNSAMLTLDDPIIDSNMEMENDVTPTIVEWKCSSCGREYKPKLDNDNSIQADGICPSCIERAKNMASKRSNAARDKKEEDAVVVCMDNSGIEDRFDVGVEYISERHPDPKMLYVWDKLGCKDEYFKQRFRNPNEPRFYIPKVGDKIVVFRNGEDT